MLPAVLACCALCLLGSQPSRATFFSGAVWQPWVRWLVRGNPLCGPRPCCPSTDCRLLASVVLGYCCGCALPIDRLPLVCPRDVSCPPDIDLLCRDYNFLMECCC
ncbi:uncharacterized protein LOC124365324 [Homalodisca vitripennis]|uniref:uncharacterized protein LOC124365324 n=1 Tax=Homalodisca vitripennis TaxID=197043 RepID=UPI001EEC5C79|nr:uncharacterized protein LOC124365324 [Homalodisca vitripennis]